MPPPPSPTGPTDIDALKLYLDSKSIPYTTITPLTGGTANFVFRVVVVVSEDKDGAATSVSTIVKHAEPYIAASYGSIAFPLERMDVEVDALKQVGALDLLPGAGVVVPRVTFYDQEARVLVMSDAGETTLKDAYSSSAGDDLDVCALGRRLGRWLAALHHSTRETSVGEGGNPVGRSIYRWAYAHLADVARGYGLDGEFCKHINDKYGALLATDDECVCQGDFWPGNVLLDGEDDDKEIKLAVVDWEMCRRGCGATDVAQFAAEAYLLDRCRGGKGMKDAFLRGYRERAEELGVDLRAQGEFVRRVAVHMGVHLGYWPTRVKWAGEEETKEIVALGHELMRRGDALDWDWLGDHMLTALCG
ncbi:MAG: hypothetical protein L6R39_007235 [Caloplaca ligustica]|nr:MAG: hypothetical protein L6R39_007235 [Caloplaca ligustica]